MPLSRTRILVFSMICLVIGWCWLWSGYPQSANGQSAKGPLAAGTVELPAQVTPFAQANLRALVAGVLQDVHADIGDSVKKDQVLAKLFAPDLEHEVEQKKAREALAQIGVEQARRSLEIVEAGLASGKAHGQEARAALAQVKAEADFANGRHDRLKKLLDQNVGGAQDVEEARYQLNAAQARVEQAEARIKLAECAQEEARARRDKAAADVKAADAGVQVARADTRRAEAMLRFADIRAPFAGVILRRGASAGETVNPAGAKEAPLFTLAQIDRVRIVFQVPEKHLGSVALGTAVKIKLAPGERVIEGKVSRLGAALDAKTHSLRAEVELPNPNGKLLPGRVATVMLRREKE